LKSEKLRIANRNLKIDDCEVTQGLTAGSEIWNLEFGICNFRFGVCNFQFAILIFQWLNQYF